MVTEATPYSVKKGAFRSWLCPNLPEEHGGYAVVVNGEGELGAKEGLRALNSGGHAAGQPLGQLKHASSCGSDILQLPRVGVGEKGKPDKGNSHLVIRASRGRWGVVRRC